MAALQKELERDSPRKDSVLSLCRQTFSKRREEILVDSGEVDATTLLNQFKELHKSHVVKSIDSYIDHAVFNPDILAREGKVEFWNVRGGVCGVCAAMQIPREGGHLGSKRGGN